MKMLLVLLEFVQLCTTGFAEDRAGADPGSKGGPVPASESQVPLLSDKSGPAEWIAALVSMIALVGVVVEYRRSKSQEKLQRAQELIDQLSSNEALLFACTVLDWGTGIIVVPGSWREVIAAASVHWNLDDIRDALHPGLSTETANSPKRLLYRHAFVHLFNHLERIGDLEKRGAVQVGDLRPIAWIAHNLKWWEYAPGYEDKIFLPAMDGWYPNKLPGKLAERLVVEFPDEGRGHEPRGQASG